MAQMAVKVPELLKLDHLCHPIGELFVVTFECEKLVLLDRPPTAAKVEVAILVFIIMVGSKIESAVPEEHKGLDLI